MSLSIKFYNFEKRHNSTKQPNEQDATTIECVLKEDTSVITPTFVLHSATMPTYNYCQWASRYYFIDDKVTRANDLWEIRCVEDYLATRKSGIGSTSAYIQYAADGYTTIVDNRVALTNDIAEASTSVGTTDLVLTTNPAVVISTTGVGSSGTYLLENSMTSAKGLLDGIDNWWSTLSVSSVQDAIKQLVFSSGAPSCIKASVGIPIVASGLSLGARTEIKLGLYPTGEYGYELNSPLKTVSVDIPIPARAGNWLDLSPYTKYMLYVPLLGSVALNATDLIGHSSINAHYSIDFTSGDVSCLIRAGDKTISMLSGNVAMNIAIGSSNIKPLGVATGVGATVAGIAAVATGGVSLAAAGAIAAGASASAQAFSGSSEGIGGMGGGSAAGQPAVFTLTRSRAVPAHSLSDFAATQGLPYMGQDTISNHSGYVQTVGFSLTASDRCLDVERREVNALMDRGVFYE